MEQTIDRDTRLAASLAAASQRREALIWGLVGVVSFSVTLPVTRIAVVELGAPFVGLGRAVVAAILAAILLISRREPLPDRRHWSGLAVVALGVIFGFPLFSALALRQLPASHSAVLVGLLPAATAVMAVIRAGERPSRGFWVSCFIGVLSVMAFAVAEGAGKPQPGDLLLLLAVVAAAVAYAEGGRLSREMEGWRVICWALVFSLPFLIPPVGMALRPSMLHASTQAWLCFAYAGCVSMFFGFFAWYRGLALGGVARIGQVQLLQPVLTLVWAALFVGETIKPLTVMASLLVVASAALTQKARRDPRV